MPLVLLQASTKNSFKSVHNQMPASVLVMILYFMRMYCTIAAKQLSLTRTPIIESLSI